MKKLGIQSRDAYATRDTFATTLLMQGRSIFWISKQLGHSKPETTMKHYAKWQDTGNADEEAKVEAAIAATKKKSLAEASIQNG